MKIPHRLRLLREAIGAARIEMRYLEMEPESIRTVKRVCAKEYLAALWEAWCASLTAEE